MKKENNEKFSEKNEKAIIMKRGREISPKPATSFSREIVMSMMMIMIRK